MSSRRNFLKSSLLPLSLGALVPSLVMANPNRSQSLLSQLLKSMTRHTIWKEVASISFSFPTHHCQGMVKIGEDYWVSSVEVLPKFAGDRSHGKGYLFQVSDTGQLLNSLELGEGPLYHPSGIDFDGTHLWIALAAYKPNSQSIIFQVNPSQMTVREIFRWEDHLGAVALNPDTQILHGASWGSRRLYQWDSKEVAKKQESKDSIPYNSQPNTSSYIDYQDIQYLGGGEMLYSGVATYKKPGEPAFSLGGLEIWDILEGKVIHQLPIPLWSPKTGRVMTQNPCFLEALAPNQVRAYFLPDDNESRLYVYEAEVELSNEK
jgi:hypothetical protein|uniref:DUF6454 family protein n=2 Tax=Algoriphagus sp. TaxID=1872435 RepID=UPI004047F6F1